MLRKLAVAAVAAALALSGLVVMPSATARVSHGDLAAAEAKLSALNERQSLLDEEYNQARIRLDGTRAKLAQSRRAMRRAAREAAQASRGLSRVVRAGYESIGSELGFLLGSDTIQSLSDRAEFMGIIAGEQQQVLDHAINARHRREWAAGSLAGAVKRQRDAVVSLATKRSQLVDVVASEQRLIAELQAQLRRQEIARQRAQAKRRAEARQRRLEELRAEQRRRAADRAALIAARAAAASPEPAAEPTSASASPSTPSPAPEPSPSSIRVAPEPSPSPSPEPTEPVAPAVSSDAQIAVDAAYSQIGVPYVYAASSPGEGFDCSGLTMWAWAQAGVSLPHSSAMQYDSLPHVSSSDLQPGDLLFFYSPIHHVAIYVGGGMVIEAPHTGAYVQKAPIYWDEYVGAARPG